MASTGDRVARRVRLALHLNAVQCEQAARQAGWGTGTTRLHGLGDGAEWVARQINPGFCTHSRFLLDLYHVGSYRFAAVRSGEPGYLTS